SKLHLIESSFEDFRAPDGSFDYIAAAQAFHWIDPAIACAKSRALLKKGGGLILIWNIRRDGSAQERAALDDIYRLCAPELANNQAGGRTAAAGTSETAYLTAKAMVDKAVADGLFLNPRTFRARWQQRCTATEYLTLLGTYSDHKRLESQQKEKLYAAIELYINGNGGNIVIPYETVALTALAA